jgi:hypothetical protein
MTDSNSSHLKRTLLAFVSGLLIAGGIVYMLTKHKQNTTATTEQNNELRKDSSIFSGEHFYRTHHHTHIDKDAESIVLMPEEESMLEKGNPTDRERKLIELLPNSPVIYLYDLKVTDYQKLYYNPDGTALSIHDTAVPNLINQAMKNFSAQKFDVAIAKLRPLLNRDDPNAFFYTGAAHFYQKNYPQALIMLNRIGNLSNNIFKQEAYWYKALCFIDLQKNDEAKTLLQHIADAQGFYAAQAKKQLAALK